MFSVLVPAPQEAFFKVLFGRESHPLFAVLFCFWKLTLFFMYLPLVHIIFSVDLPSFLFKEHTHILPLIHRIVLMKGIAVNFFISLGRVDLVLILSHPLQSLLVDSSFKVQFMEVLISSWFNSLISNFCCNCDVIFLIVLCSIYDFFYYILYLLHLGISFFYYIF